MRDLLPPEAAGYELVPKAPPGVAKPMTPYQKASMKLETQKLEFRKQEFARKSAGRGGKPLADRIAKKAEQIAKGNAEYKAAEAGGEFSKMLTMYPRFTEAAKLMVDPKAGAAARQDIQDAAEAVRRGVVTQEIAMDRLKSRYPQIGDMLAPEAEEETWLEKLKGFFLD